MLRQQHSDKSDTTAIVVILKFEMLSGISKHAVNLKIKIYS